MKCKVELRKPENQYGKLVAFGDAMIDNSVLIKDIRVFQGENGVYARMPQVTVQKEDGTKYRDLITGVSREFSDFLNKAVKKAYEGIQDQKSVSLVLEDKTLPDNALYYTPHYKNMDKGNLKGMCSLTVGIREKDGFKAPEKSLFTIQSIRVMQNDKGNLFVSMPSKKSKSEKYDYTDIVVMTKKSQDFVNGLIINKALTHDKSKEPVDKGDMQR